jgi:hypothetical protein
MVRYVAGDRRRGEHASLRPRGSRGPAGAYCTKRYSQTSPLRMLVVSSMGRFPYGSMLPVDRQPSGFPPVAAGDRLTGLTRKPSVHLGGNRARQRREQTDDYGRSRRSAASGADALPDAAKAKQLSECDATAEVGLWRTAPEDSRATVVCAKVKSGSDRVGRRARTSRRGSAVSGLSGVSRERDRRERASSPDCGGSERSRR